MYSIERAKWWAGSGGSSAVASFATRVSGGGFAWVGDEARNSGRRRGMCACVDTSHAPCAEYSTVAVQLQYSGSTVAVQAASGASESLRLHHHHPPSSLAPHPRARAGRLVYFFHSQAASASCHQATATSAFHPASPLPRPVTYVDFYICHVRPARWPASVRMPAAPPGGLVCSCLPSWMHCTLQLWCGSMYSSSVYSGM